MAWRCSALTNSGLIDNLKRAQLISSKVVEDAMRAVDRKRFVPTQLADAAYEDSPLPIGHNATISAPHMHAMCLELLKDNLKPGSIALDVGSGSGYLTAAMANMVAPTGHVYGVEHIKELVQSSIKAVEADPKTAKIITLKATDGRLGYPDAAPFDAIHVGAASPNVPKALVEQLRVGGRMVIPVGPQHGDQYLLLVEKKSESEIKESIVTGVRYVPLTDAEKQVKG